MSGLTISVSKGKVAFAHDLRNETYVRQQQALGKMQNINADLTHLNQDLIIEFEKKQGGRLDSCKNLEDEFNNLFKEEIELYNNSQRKKGHPERQIQNYYQHIKTNKGKKKNQMHTSYEYVLQFGNRNDDWETQKRLVKNSLFRLFKDEKFQKYFHVNYATLHVDETGGSPHVHLNITPMAQGYKGILQIRPSLNKACMQFAGTKKRSFAYQNLIEFIKNDIMEKDLIENGIERIYTKEDRAHSDVATYKKIKRTEEILEVHEAILNTKDKEVKTKKLELEEIVEERIPKAENKLSKMNGQVYSAEIYRDNINNEIEDLEYKKRQVLDEKKVLTERLQTSQTNVENLKKQKLDLLEIYNNLNNELTKLKTK